MTDKRRHRRYIRRCDAMFSSGSITHHGIASNFSLSGLYVRSVHPWPPGTEICIDLELPDGKTSKLKGTVVRSGKAPARSLFRTKIKSGMGIDITEKDDNYLFFMKSLSDTEV